MTKIAGRYVLDSSALISFLWDEAGSQTVEDILVEEDAEVFMGAVNFRMIPGVGSGFRDRRVSEASVVRRVKW